MKIHFDKRDWLNKLGAVDTGSVATHAEYGPGYFQANMAIRDCSRSVDLEFSMSLDDVKHTSDVKSLKRLKKHAQKSIDERLKKVGILKNHLDALEQAIGTAGDGYLEEVAKKLESLS